MRMSKKDSKQLQKDKFAASRKGEGLFVYRNRTRADLILDRPACDNVRIVKPGQEFKGDSYFMKLVHENRTCIHVRTIISPEEERIAKKMEEKLIVDQPDIVTAEGKVEHVVVGEKKVKPLNETPTQPSPAPRDVLITEDPLDGVDILG